MRQRKRITALLMAGLMVFTNLPVNALAVEKTETGGLCEHHPEHTAECGYTEGVDGTPCNHQHKGNGGEADSEGCYVLVTECVHEHMAECYPQESGSDDTASPPNADEVQPTECTHECSEENGCITEQLDCKHEHNSECGYVPAVEGTPCTFVCEECNGESSEQEKDQCSCDAPCTEDAINIDCPVCSVDGADLTACKGGVEEIQQITITEFDPLDEEVANQIISAEKKLNLPDTLGASGYVGTQDSGGAEHLTIEGVTWEPDQPYDENAEQGAWLFTAVLPEEGYTLAEGVSLPEISVMVEPVNLLAGEADVSTGDVVIGVCENCQGHTITGQSSQFTIQITGGTHNIILQDVEIDASGCAFALENDAVVNLTLAGTNSLKSGADYAGLQVPEGAEITINGSGDASLTAQGGSQGAGIGGGKETPGGTITINGGIVRAIGGNWAAAIGDGDNAADIKPGTSANITIAGGKVTLSTNQNSKGGCLGYADDGNATGGSVSITGGELVFQSKPAVKVETLIDISGCILTLLEGDTSLEAANNCLLIQGNTITVRGGYTLQEDFTLDIGKTLEIPAGATFDTSNATLINNGTILLNGGTLTVNSYSGSGTVYKSGTSTLNGTAADAVSPIEACITGDFLLSPNTLVKDTDYAYENNTLTILNSTPVTISGSTTADKIAVGSSVAAEITLDGLSITSGTCAFMIPGTASAEITLVGDNTLKSGESCAGLAVEQEGTVTIGGSGSLQCTGGSQAAGIGGGYTFNAGTINITGGTIIAQGGSDGAGIGGGHANDDHNNQFGRFDAINITGGVIDAYSPGNAAAIGTGCWASSCPGSITIENAQVTANTTGSYKQCAAIGRGISSGDNDCQVTIKNSIVSAQNVLGNSISGENGVPDIQNSIVRVSEGSDNDNVYVVYGDCETPSAFTLAAGESLVIPQGATLTVPDGSILNNGGTITNLGTLTVTGMLQNTGTLINQGDLTITGTLKNDGMLIDLSGSITGTVSGTPAVTLTSVPYLVYDETGQKWDGNTCSDFTLVTSGMASWPAGWYVALGQITIPSRVIASGDVHLILMDNCELTVENGISVENTGTLHIYSQSHGDEMGKLIVPIGGITGGTIVIDGGSIKSKGGHQGPGIGGRKTVVIHGGRVEAVAGAFGAGIGGSDGGSGGEITITGGTVTATSIGGGSNGSGGIITIDGGTINTGIIGGQGSGSNGTFTTGGNAVIYASAIKDKTGQDNWNGVIFEGEDGKGTVYGKVNLQEDLTVTIEQTLTVQAGSILIIPEGVTMTCNGTLTNEGAIQVFGSLIIKGSASNSGVILPVEGSQITGTITGNQPGLIDPVSYLACNEETGQDWVEKTCEFYLPITESTTNLKSGWYVARDEVTIDTRVGVTGNVHLILADDCVLKVNGGLTVHNSNHLHIYSQSGETGKLIATAKERNAAIGSNQSAAAGCGTITINGGDIEAHGSGGGAGIGGGIASPGGKITINGGNVQATAQNDRRAPAAIGGGGGNQDSSTAGGAGTIVINGGVVTANGCEKGIGSGQYHTGTILITGGVITANGIGTGNYYASADTTISGGIVFSSGGINEAHKDTWSGLIVNSGKGGFYDMSNVTLNENTEVPDWAILNIESGQTLTVPAGVTLTNRGNIFLYNGNLSGDGTIQNDGIIFYTGEKPSGAAGVWIPIEADADVIRLKDTPYDKGAEINGSSCDPCRGHIIFGAGENLDRAITVDGGHHNIILIDVKLKADGWPFKCAFELKNSAEVTLTLVGENKLESLDYYAGLQVPQGTALTINAIEDASLTAQGGKAAAGIGGGQKNKGGNITINSGNIQATAGSWAAAIGGGDDSNGSGEIAINGGKITLATGGSPSSGCLGYGDDPGASGGSVTITGGELVFQNGPFIKNKTTSIKNCKITLAEGDHTLDLDVVEQSVVYQGGTTTLCGTFTLDSDKILAEGKDLVIYKGAALEIPNGKKLSVAGTLTNNGLITGSGTLGDTGGSLEGSGIITKTITNEFLKKSGIAIAITPVSGQVTYGSTVSITATVSAAPVNAIANVLRQATPNQMVFFAGAGDDKTLLGKVPVNNGSATLPDVVISAKNGFSAGDNIITAEYGGSMTLTEITGTETLTVGQAKLTITAKDQEITYGNAIAGGISQVNVTGLVAGETLTGITLMPSGADATASGTITPKNAVISGGANNYDISYVNGSLTILQAVQPPLNITGKPDGVIRYGDTFSLSASGGNNGIPVTWNVTGPATVSAAGEVTITGVGDVTITAAKAGGTNYKDVSCQYEFTTAPAELTITGATLASKTYDGNKTGTVNTITFEGLKNSETLTLGTDYTATAEFTDANAGINDKTAKITAMLISSGPVAKNYRLANNSFDLTGQTINKGPAPAAPTVTGSYAVSTTDKAKFVYTVNAISGAEYSKDDSVWQDSPVFDGIEPNSTITFYARIKETDNVNAGNAGNTGEVTFNKLPNEEQPSLVVSVTGENHNRTVTITPVESAEYSFDDGRTYGTPNVKTGCSGTVKVAIRYAATATLEASQPTKQDVSTDKKEQTDFAISPIGSKSYGAPAFTLSTTGGNGTGGITFESSDESVLSISSTTATIKKAGTVIITVTKAADNDYNAAEAQITLTIHQAKPTLTLTPSATEQKGGGEVILTLAGLPADGTATISTSVDSVTPTETENGVWKVNLPNKDETYTFTASYAGDENHEPAAADCTVTVQRRSSSSGGSGSSGSARPTGGTETGSVTPVTENGKQMVTVTITKQKLDDLVERNVDRYEVNSGVLNFGFSRGALQQLNNVSGQGDIVLKAVQAANPAGGGRPAWDMTLVYRLNGVDTPITLDGSKTVSVKLPYTPAAVEQTALIYAITIDSASKIIWRESSSYDPDQKSVLFSITGAGTYGVGYQTKVPAFTDISGHWAKDHILFVTSRGLLAGTSNNRFSPDTGITQGMFALSLERLASMNGKSYKADTAIFAPDAAMTREALAMMLKDYADKMGYALPATLEAVTFADSGSIRAEAKTAVQAMQRAGILSGKDGNRFDPKGMATRGEAAAALHRFVEIVIDPQAANGWKENASGTRSYYKSGKSAIGWMYDGNWYWLEKGGIPFTGGWKQLAGKWYYLNADGTMAADTVIDGYTIGPDGARK